MWPDMVFNKTPQKVENTSKNLKKENSQIAAKACIWDGLMQATNH